MFQLTEMEAEALVSQNVIPHKKHFGGSLPYAFTEQGVAMLSSILNSEQAIKINIAIMRAFVRLREILSSDKELDHKLTLVEKRIEKHDGEIKAIFGGVPAALIANQTLENIRQRYEIRHIRIKPAAR